MEQLPDDLLVEAYLKAVSLRLNEDFIQLIESELERRSLHVRLPVTNRMSS
ncbi:sporulation histidine kinase inhibitor Sda [Bacillus sp. FJAT-44742]|uniref:sporulation histidine kinase inhibitor Sda n=1 Tax=Bacillus sp. FJAT-44742 TaxID=2014005 RepID=UPI000C2407FB|nr:sporulation histidine kinase inhibitor Sda [Bacillus sp. FJAT-44742]